REGRCGQRRRGEPLRQAAVEFPGAAALGGLTLLPGQATSAPAAVVLADAGKVRLPIVAGSVKEPVEELGRDLRRVTSWAASAGGERKGRCPKCTRRIES